MMLLACPEAGSGVQDVDQRGGARPCTHLGTAGVGCIPPCGPLAGNQEEKRNPQAILGSQGSQDGWGVGYVPGARGFGWQRASRRPRLRDCFFLY